MTYEHRTGYHSMVPRPDVRIHYINAPQAWYGHQGQHRHDICSFERNEPPSNFLSDEGVKTCNALIDAKLTANTNLIVGGLVLLVALWCVFSLLPICMAILFDYVVYRPQRVAAALKEKETRAKDAEEKEHLITNYPTYIHT
jgi:hypothetical protein